MTTFCFAKRSNLAGTEEKRVFNAFGALSKLQSERMSTGFRCMTLCPNVVWEWGKVVVVVVPIVLFT